VAIAILASAGCLALVLNEYWLTIAQEELRTVAQSAALAGAQQLACDDLLKKDVDPLAISQRAREAVEKMAQANQVAGALTTRLDVRLARTEIDLNTGSTIVDETEEFPTSVLVRARRDYWSHNPVPLLGPYLVGRPAADVAATCEASVCNVISGVRPVGPACVPAWPLAVLESSPDQRVPTWSRQIELHQGSDNFSWDAEQQQVVQASDGLPEILLTSQSQSGPNNLVLVDIGTNFREDLLEDQFRDGWSAEDLEDFGGEFSITGGDLILRGSANLEGAPLENLEAQIGQARILLLYQPAKNANGSRSSTSDRQVQITRLVAGRIMDISTGKTGQTIVLQPAVIATRAAILDEDSLYSGQTQGNPYIFRLAVTR
jgi:hypothetical protein